ncbi:MAG: acetate--CoA ligase [Dehalococcoidia bacterium]|nr:acetate--CoA ligase [Dehalococcoidia bacterium]
MNYSEIAKPKTKEMQVAPNLLGEGDLTSKTPWPEIERELGVDGRDSFNLAQLAIDRHCENGWGDKVALLWEGKDGGEEAYTFEQLRTLTNKFAHALAGLGVQKGDRVFIFAGRVPELYVSVFGTLKLGAIIGPLFSAFGPDPVRDRLLDSGAEVLITTPDLKARLSTILKDLPQLRHTILIEREVKAAELDQGDVRYEQAMAAAPSDPPDTTTSREDYSIMHYTSGTTGKPKGAVHVHNAAIQHYATGKWALDLHPDDIYWCTADPGWVTGTSYGMSAPWLNGVTQLIYESGFGASAWYSAIQKHRVTVWYTAPTAIRMLMKAGDEITQKYNLSSLRHICSVGEPLNPEAVLWGHRVFHQAIHDNWWQTETGAILIANYPFMAVRPGSMGKPIPGTTPGIIDEAGNEMPHDAEGDLAVRPGWPSMFRAYWNNEALYRSRFNNGWYITGDRARKDKDGYFWFVGRTDDVINTAGHLVGPFEVESAFMEHPAVAEAGVIGKPDPLAMEVVKAFVALKGNYEPTDNLRRELMRFIRSRLSAAVAPREIEFLPSLPKTRSGKIMRRLLKAKELGLPLGDTSTLEED